MGQRPDENPATCDISQKKMMNCDLIHTTSYRQLPKKHYRTIQNHFFCRPGLSPGETNEANTILRVDRLCGLDRFGRLPFRSIPGNVVRSNSTRHANSPKFGKLNATGRNFPGCAFYGIVCVERNLYRQIAGPNHVPQSSSLHHRLTKQIIRAQFVHIVPR